MVRAGGSASRTIGDRSVTDPGGGSGGPRRRQPAWQLPVGRVLHWISNEQAFPPLGGHSTTDCGRHQRQLLDRTEEVLGSGTPMVPVSTLEMGGGPLPVAPQVTEARKHRRGMRPAGEGTAENCS